MIKNISVKFKRHCLNVISGLTGAARRAYAAKLVNYLGQGGQQWVTQNLHISHHTIAKGQQELASGKVINNRHLCGRRKVEEKLPKLPQAVKQILDPDSQTDPSFKTTRLYTRLTIKTIRKQLLANNYSEIELPCNETLRRIIHDLGYKIQKVQKAKPFKKIPETDAIFANVNAVKAQYHGQENVLELSIDTKDRVKIGPYSRGGSNWVKVKAADHDFGTEYFTPFGLLNLTRDQLELVFTATKVTADFMVDALEQHWQREKQLNPKLDCLVIYADNGPENSSRRTQYMKRLIDFAASEQIKIILAYYPPYHSKYNPVERAWGVLEQHWNGALLKTKAIILNYAQSMTWKGKHPRVRTVEREYKTGIKLTKEEMEICDKMIKRSNGIEKWAVEIEPKEFQKAL